MYKICGAGILPFTVRTDGTIVFLMGKERVVPGWRSSGKMSAFEGGHQNHESATRNAVREFCEESLCVLTNDDHTVHKLQSELEGGDYALRICMRDDILCEEHHTFVKRFEWCDDLCATFDRRRDALTHIQTLTERLSVLENRVPHRYPFLRVGDLLCRHGVCCHVLTILAATQKSGMLHIKYTSEQEGQKTLVAHADAAMQSNFVEMVRVRAEMDETIRQLPAIIRRRAITLRSNGVAPMPIVRREWLEKQSIHEMCIDDVASALSNDTQMFRFYFYAVIRETLNAFRVPSH